MGKRSRFFRGRRRFETSSVRRSFHCVKWQRKPRVFGREATDPSREGDALFVSSSGLRFLSENAEFAESCLVEGLQFIGPSSRVVKTLGDKLEAIRLAEQNSIPVLAGTRGPTTLAQSKDFSFNMER